MEVAVEDGLLPRIEMPPYRGVDAVSPHEQVAVCFAGGLARGVNEACVYFAVTLDEARKPVAANDRIVTKPFRDRVEQHLVQLAARDRNLWPPISGFASARLA